MHHRVEQRDDVPVHFHRVRHQNRIVIDAQKPLRDTGFAVARAAVQEQRLVPDQRRPQLVQQRVRQDQVVKRLPQALPAQTHAGRLRLHPVVILLQRNRRRPYVLAGLVPRRGLLAAVTGQRERVIVPHHALHFDDVLVAELVIDGFQDRKGQLQRVVQLGQRAAPIQPQVAQDQVAHQGAADSQILDAVGHGGTEFAARGLGLKDRVNWHSGTDSRVRIYNERGE